MVDESLASSCPRYSLLICIWTKCIYKTLQAGIRYIEEKHMSDTRLPIVPFNGFEWDEQKRQRNLVQHGIDFEDAARIFESEILRLRSDRENEIRYVALGLLEDIEIAVVYTVRSNVCRLISARRASQDERKAYYEALGGDAEKGQD